jgi:hypothetical protein
VDGVRRPWRSELHDPERVTDDEIDIESPAQVPVKMFGAIDVRNRDDDDLELHINQLCFRGLDCSVVADCSGTHVYLLNLDFLRVSHIGDLVARWDPLSTGESALGDTSPQQRTLRACSARPA